ncbi:uncharacterized protein LOC123321942 [Coccinella septempunctata]|uniref:uncharacterized protein LOC123321942 n=1 Tax=Coccinella septempunctata TaxID=41139 RepID=UPI001D089AFA|nr:uncharacterized protein LOC123321942 [Coccinella septempunctata]
MLPPTESALMQLTSRVYYQIQIWLGRRNLKPEDWGWHRSNFMLLPKMMSKAIAPQELLNNVFCSCNGKCDTARCSYKKAGLKCTRFCKVCNGISCENFSNLIKRSEMNSDVDEDDGDEDDLEADNTIGEED